MVVRDRVLAALRARFWLHMWRQHIVKLSNRFPDLYSTSRSFISPASFHIFNRLCDTMILLVIVYARHYPDQPFCPWLLGTEFVEHFFGLARMLLPNFTYAEFLKMVQHIMVRQRILLSGKFAEDRERKSAAGYIMDYDARPLTATDKHLATITLSNHDLNDLVVLGYREAYQICKDLLRIPVALPSISSPVQLILLGAQLNKPRNKPTISKGPVSSDSDSDSWDSEEDLDAELDADGGGGGDDMGEGLDISASTAHAARDAARYSALCEDYDNTMRDCLNDTPGKPSLPTGPSVANPNHDFPTPASAAMSNVIIVDDSVDSAQIPGSSGFMDGAGKISVLRMLEIRRCLQSGTTAHSERVVKLNPKVALTRVLETQQNEINDKKMTAKEASHRVRVAQDLDVALKQPKKTRELRWQAAVKSLQLVVSSEGMNIFDFHYVFMPQLIYAELPNMSTKNISIPFPIKLGGFVIMRTAQRTYIGEVLDMYKKGLSGRYGSIEKSESASGLQALSLRVYLALGVVSHSRGSVSVWN